MSNERVSTIVILEMTDVTSTDKASPVQRHYDAIISQFDDISQAEKNDLVRQIEEVVSSESISATSRLIAFKPEHKGILFPAIINSTAVILIALVVVLSALYFRIRHAEMSIESTAFISTERRILDEFRKESDRQLQQKDEKIVTIQAEVKELDRQIAELKRIMQSSIDDREAELKQAMLEALDSERARLRAQGISEQEIQRRIKELETRMSSEYNRQLEQYRKASEASFKEREEALLEEKEKAEKRLQDVNREKDQLLEETQRKEAELKARYDTEKARLREQTSEAEQRFRAIAELREKEQLVSDQILGSYAAIIGKIEDEDFAGAYSDIAKLRELLLNESLDYMPTVVRRRKIELFMVNMLEDRVEAELFATAEATPGGETTGDTATVSVEELEALREAARHLSKIQQIVEMADASSRNGDIRQAERLYTSAIDELQTVASATRALETIKGLKHRTIMQDHINQASALSARESYEEANREYRRGVLSVSESNRDVLTVLLDGLSKSIREQERALQEGELADLESRIKAARREGREQGFAAGRESAFSDTMKLLASIEGGEAEKADKELEEKAASEPQLKSVYEETQMLIETARGQAAVPSADLRLLGVLATVSSTELVIEPLIQIELKANTPLWIKRRSRSGGVIEIAQAMVQRASDRRITARLERLLSEGETPRASDLVYIAR